MKEWLKKQATEFTAWAGLAMVLGAFFFPRTLFLCLGLLLISVDDEKAKAWAVKVAPWVSKKIDSAS